MKQFQMGKKERLLEPGFQPEKRACSQKHRLEKNTILETILVAQLSQGSS